MPVNDPIRIGLESFSPTEVNELLLIMNLACLPLLC